MPRSVRQRRRATASARRSSGPSLPPRASSTASCLARVQRARARAGARPAHPAARAPALHRDLLDRTSTSSTWCAWPGCSRRRSGRPRPAPGRASRARSSSTAISERVGELVREQRELLDGDVLPELLAEHGIAIVSLDELRRRRAAPSSTAAFLGVDLPRADAARGRPRAPVPVHLEPLALARRVVRDPASGARRFARVKVPEVLPRFWDGRRGRALPPARET